MQLIKTLLFLPLLTLCLLANGQNSELTKLGIEGGVSPEGIKAGESAPAVTGKTADGKTFDLNDYLKNGTVALVFYRGYWCPHCTRALSAYADSLDYLAEKNVQVIAITPETYENVEKTRDAIGGNITIVSDTDGSIMQAFGVSFNVTDKYNSKIESSKGAAVSEMNGQSQAVLPIPATYVIAPDINHPNGLVIWRHFNPDYRDRATVKQIVDAATMEM